VNHGKDLKLGRGKKPQKHDEKGKKKKNERESRGGVVNLQLIGPIWDQPDEILKNWGHDFQCRGAVLP